jgi:hypothetical protein
MLSLRQALYAKRAVRFYQKENWFGRAACVRELQQDGDCEKTNG